MFIRLITTFSLLVLLFAMTGLTTAEKHVIKVQLRNIKEYKGTAYVLLFLDKGFPDKGNEIQKKSVKITKNTAYVTFSVPNGEYAIAMHHDINNNNEMDKNWLGYPLEPYGFSRNFKPTISAPDFSDCSFKVNNSNKNLIIDLIQ